MRCLRAITAWVLMLVTVLTPPVRCEAITRRVTLPHNNGLKGAPNWSGSLYCPMDYGIVIDKVSIAKPCKGISCSQVVVYNPVNMDDVRNNCTMRNFCQISIWQSSSVDGKELFIDYTCKSLLQTHLFSAKLVKRFYPSYDTPVTEYCAGASRHRRAGDDHIGRLPASTYTFDDAVQLRTILADARVRGYSRASSIPNSVFRTIIVRTRRHPDGEDIVLPVYVVADLTNNTLVNSNTRINFSTSIITYIYRCGQRRNSNPDDRGHLVAYTLGGKDIAHNLVPMASDLNRAQGIWNRRERDVRKYVKDHPTRMVRWEVLVIYSVRSSEPFRPVAFALRYTKYEDKNHLTYGVEGIETFINENENYRNDQCTLGFEDFFYPANQQNAAND